MPHIIIEYPQDLLSDEIIETCLDLIQQSAANTGLFDVSHIRVRAIPLKHYRSGAGVRISNEVEKKAFVHVQCRIHAGRSDHQKKQLTETIIKALAEQELGVDVMTAEVVELDRSSYTKFVSKV